MGRSGRGQGVLLIWFHSPSYQTPTHHCQRHLGPLRRRGLVQPGPSSPGDSVEGRKQAEPRGAVWAEADGEAREEAGTCVRVFCQITVGAGSPEMGTSSLNLFPATTTMVSGVRPGQSRWIFGGSVGSGLGQAKERGRACEWGVTGDGDAGSMCPWWLVFKNINFNEV